MNASEILAAIEALPLLLASLTKLAPGAVKLYSDVAHGEGGATKVQNVLGDLSGIFAGAAAETAVIAPSAAAIVSSAAPTSSGKAA